PGALRAYPTDLDGDGRLDVVALFGQGDEGIYAYYNEGEGQFREEALLRFPPSWGSAWFELGDYDGDGDLDLLYAAGDNADYPPLLKPYHGVRLYRNDGQNHFKEAFFVPLPGAYGAAHADYDGDGDLDLAVISFFPDFSETTERSFVYLENRSGRPDRWSFVAREVPEVAAAGRWIVLDAGDLEGDGDTDLLLGSLAFEVVDDGERRVDRWVEAGVPALVLENRSR
ncbi:MAG: FG-GAP-like repeat-containing protein, partial [Catalinimonas sp.]